MFKVLAYEHKSCNNNMQQKKSVLTQWLEYCATNTKVTSSNLVRVYKRNIALKKKKIRDML